MGVDIYLKSGKTDFSCRLYWITNLIDRYGWKYKGEAPELSLDRKLKLEETKQLLNFLKFCLSELLKDKKREITKFGSVYFKKIAGINASLKKLIDLVKSKPIIDKMVLARLRGLIRRLDSFADIYSADPRNEKAEIRENYDERISLVKKLITMLTAVISKNGSVSIG